MKIKDMMILTIICIILIIGLYNLAEYGRINPYCIQLGNSMYPTYSNFTILPAYTTDKKPVTNDSIIVYLPNGNNTRALVIHRVIAINEDGTFTTKGDNNPATDQVMKIANNVSIKHVYGVI